MQHGSLTNGGFSPSLQGPGQRGHSPAQPVFLCAADLLGVMHRISHPRSAATWKLCSCIIHSPGCSKQLYVRQIAQVELVE